MADTRWIPAAVKLRSGANAVTCIDVGDDTLPEPFLWQTFVRLTSRNASCVKSVSIESLIATSPRRRALAGFIYHVSRCGSTAVTNALKQVEGLVVLSEPPAISDLLESDLPRIEKSRALSAVIGHSQNACRAGERLVIKFTSWNLLHLSLFEDLWPTVPRVLIYRHPVEVMVSLRRKPPGWWNSLNIKDSPHGMSGESSAARMLADFYRSGVQGVTRGLCPMNYSQLSTETVAAIAARFGAAVDVYSVDRIAESLTRYAKDPFAPAKYLDDSASKRSEADTDTIRAVEEWVVPWFSQLEELARRKNPTSAA